MINTELLTLSFKETVPVRQKNLTKNTFLVVSFLNSKTYLSILEGVHSLSLKEIEFALFSFFNKYSPAFNLNFEQLDFSQPFFNITRAKEKIHPELLFCIEAIFINYFIENKKINLLENKINLLFTDKTDTTNIDSLLINQTHSPTIKVKMNHFDKSLLEKLSELIKKHPSLKLRIDSNRGFEVRDFLFFYQQLNELNKSEIKNHIEYFEEPLIQFNDYAYLQKLNIPIAFDESAPYFFEKKSSETLVIKPSLYGISTIFSLIKNSNHQVIISSCFEHQSALNSLHFLANQSLVNVHGIESKVID